MDEIIRAVRDCPSGALSYGIDDVEARGEVDHHHGRGPSIEVTKDGPYRVTGAIPEQCLKPVDLPGRARERGVPSRCPSRRGLKQWLALERRLGRHTHAYRSP